MNDPITAEDLVTALRERAPHFAHEPRFDTYQMWTIDLLEAAATMIEQLTTPQTFVVDWGRETSADRFRHTFTNADDLVAVLRSEVLERGPVISIA
jgi:hypothetical protein